MRATTSLLSAVLISLLAGCGSSHDDAFLNDLGRITARYQVLDLSSGEVTPQGSIDDLLLDPNYRQTHIVFHRIEGAAVIGAAADQLGSDLDAPRQQVNLPPYYLAAFELSQAQWQAIAGSEPWLDLDPAESDDVAIGAQFPAVGMSLQDARQALSAFSAGRRFRLELPTDQQWEAACRAGSQTLFHWGDSELPGTAEEYARCWETAKGHRGPLAIGSHQANAWGFHDMHGNVAEFTASGAVRGGSWHSALLGCRSAASATIPADIGHALVGLRLRYRLD